MKRYLVYSHPAAFIGQWVVIDEVWCALRWTDVQHVKLAFDHLRVLVFCGAPAHLISIGGWVKIASRLRIFVLVPTYKVPDRATIRRFAVLAKRIFRPLNRGPIKLELHRHN